MCQDRKNVVVRVDSEFHKEIRLHVIKKGMTIQDYVVELIKNDMAEAKKEDNK